jgi:hypothetical protein
VPTVVLLFLVGLYLPLPEDYPHALSPLAARWVAALLMLPVLLGGGWLVRELARGAWRSTVVLLGLTVAAAAVWIGVFFWLDAGVADPREHYVLEGWWLVLLLGGYAAACLVAIYEAFWFVAAKGRAVWRLLRPSSPTALRQQAEAEEAV